MRITFVVPDSPSVSRFFYSQGMTTPPVGACRRAAAELQRGAEVAVVDGTAVAEPFNVTLRRVEETAPDVIVIGTSEIHLWTFQGTAAYPYWVDFARRLRIRVGSHVPILMDNSYAKQAWRSVLEREQSIDGVLLSTDVDVSEVVRHLRGGKPAMPRGVALRSVGAAVVPRGQHSSVSSFPAYHLLRDWPLGYGIDRHLCLSSQLDVMPVLPILSMQGCPYACSFCATPVHFDGAAAQRSPESFVLEISRLVDATGMRRFSVWDDTFTLSVTRMNTILAALEQRELRVEWWCFGRIEWVNRNRETVERMARNGCKMMWIGVEATDKRDLENWHRTASLDDALNATRVLTDTGIVPTTSYIIGNVEQTRDDIFRTLEHSRRTFDLGAVNVYTLLSPMPGTSIHTDLAGRGLLATTDLRLYNGTRAVVRYPHLDTEFVEETFYDAYRASILSPRFLKQHGRVGFSNAAATDTKIDWDSGFRKECHRMMTLEHQHFGAPS
jgi:radical SAM superfamily enzyme YgiQ (UPF0313 family)